jgi:hypothetical protein
MGEDCDGCCSFESERATPLGFAKVGDKRGAKSITLRFPFNAPGYLIKRAAGDRGLVFDVVRCPVASYFRKRDAADLCVASWCNLDYALAELTNETLVRTKTLAGGDDRCDFRITKREDGEAEPAQLSSRGGNLFQRRRLSLPSDPNNVV